ncbi:MAG: GIY-YIG nuclease family protein [Chloroflexi bacterium]|nr:GIY-YIG nuclease family protein [Chloroflexota bacterium]
MTRRPGSPLTPSPDRPYFVYVLRCADGTLYTGSTSCVERRLASHQAGRGARYTRARLPVALLATWPYPDRATAQRAEAAFKRLPRTTKLRYLAADGPTSTAYEGVSV